MIEDYAMAELPAGSHVLLVANYSVFQDQLVDHLQRCRCKVKVVDNISRARELVTKHPEMYDILIVSIDTQGIEKFEHLMLAHIVKILPIIILSQSQDGNMIMKVYAKGASSYLFKPIQINHLKNIMCFIKKQNHINIVQENNISLNLEDHNYEGPQNEVSNGKNDPKCDELDEGENKEQDNNKEDASSMLKEKRLIWTNELKSKFQDAVNKLGVHEAKPKQILKIMKVPFLTRYHVASHLQKYRDHLKKVNSINTKRKARITNLIKSMMLVEPRSDIGYLIASNDSLAPIWLEHQGSHIKPKMDIIMSQGDISSNITGDHSVYPQSNKAYLQQVPRNGFTYDLSSMYASSRDSSMPEETNFNASFGDQVLPSQEDLIGIMEPKNDIIMPLNSELDPNLLQITGCNEMPLADLPTLPFMAKSGLELPLGPQLQREDVLIKAKFQQVTQSSSKQFYEYLTNNSLLEPQVQYQASAINPQSFIGAPYQQEDQFNKVMSNAFKRSFEDSLNNELMEPRLQYQDSLPNIPPLIEVPSRKEDRHHELGMPNIIDPRDCSAENEKQLNDKSLSNLALLPPFEGFGEDGAFAEQTLKVMSEMGLMTQVEQFGMQSMDFD